MKYILLMMILSATVSCISQKKKQETLSVGIPGAWGDLIPSLQHTAYADAMLSNEFETLVTQDSTGITKGMVAKSWKITDNYKTIEFRIDTSKRFSNGDYITAFDVKNSWEHSLSLKPVSSNSSVSDVLYKVVGYKNFKKTKKLSGLIVKDKETFIVKFNNPFRMVLENLTFSRLGVFKIINGEYIGTGPYKFVSKSKENAILERNPYYGTDKGFEKIEFKHVSVSDAVQALKDKKVQVFLFADKIQIDDCINKTGNIGCYLGNESSHFSLVVNGMKKSIFSNKNYRLALQALLLRDLKKDDIPASVKFSIRVDPQIYLPFQKGRLEPEEAKKIILSGEKYIPDLLKELKKKPLKLMTTKSTAWTIDYLKKKGVPLSEESRVYESKDIVDSYYKKYDADLIALGMGVMSGDPDGIYHALGKKGSISSPMLARELLGKLLEEGRTITDPKKIDQKYKEVSRAALLDVPFIHFGFMRTRSAYRNDLIKVSHSIKRREDHAMLNFGPF
ncbi:MAG: hypothetical protein KDD45_03855 [Bdellovibrionales bacterium]|nr:hypothetical protein [Bdellovibrionales bacterium]